MIRSFRDRDTEAVAQLRRVRKFSESVQNRALEKLRLLDNSENLMDLRNPPGNRLESLSGNRRGQYSIRINDQWRVCFTWDGKDAWDVEIVDYH